MRTHMERQIMTNYFLKVLTPKGLNYLLRTNRDDTELMIQVRQELQRRNLPPVQEQRQEERMLDGYERDR